MCVLCWWTEYRRFQRQRHHSVLLRKPQTAEPATAASNESQSLGRQSRARTPTAAFNGTKALGGSRGISIRPHPPPPSTNSDPKQLQTKPALQPLAIGNPSVQRKTGCGLARIPQPGTTGLHGDDTAIKHSKSRNRHPLRNPPRLASADANVMPLPARLRQSYRYNASNTPRNPSPRIDRHKLPSALPAARQAGLSSAAHPS